MTAEQRNRIASVLEAMAMGLDEIHAQDEDVVPALALFHNASPNRGRAGDFPAPNLARRPIIWPPPRTGRRSQWQLKMHTRGKLYF